MNKSEISKSEIFLNIFLLLFSLSFFISTLYLNIYWQGNPVSASKNLRKIHLDSTNGVEKIKAADLISKYVWSQGDLRLLRLVELDSQKLSISELSHLKDVKGLFSNMTKIGLAAIYFMVFFTTIIYFTNAGKLTNGLFWTGSALFFFVLLTGVLSYFDFSKLFNYLHSPFFQKNSWIFSSNSILIQLFPLKFWEMTIKRILLAILAESIMVISFAFILKKKITEKH